MQCGGRGRVEQRPDITVIGFVFTLDCFIFCPSITDMTTRLPHNSVRASRFGSALFNSSPYNLAVGSVSLQNMNAGHHQSTYFECFINITEDINSDKNTWNDCKNNWCKTFVIVCSGTDCHLGLLLVWLNHFIAMKLNNSIAATRVSWDTTRK